MRSGAFWRLLSGHDIALLLEQGKVEHIDRSALGRSSVDAHNDRNLFTSQWHRHRLKVKGADFSLEQGKVEHIDHAVSVHIGIPEDAV